MMAKLFAVRLGAGHRVLRDPARHHRNGHDRPAKDMYRRRIEEGPTPAHGRRGTGRSRAMATGRIAFCTGQSVQADGDLHTPAQARPPGAAMTPDHNLPDEPAGPTLTPARSLWKRPPAPIFSTARSFPQPMLSPILLGARTASSGNRLGWDLAFRRHILDLGLGIAEAMDTAQRGMGWTGPAH